MRTFFVAIVTAVIGALAAGIGGEWATRAHGMSNFEGGRAMFIAFVIAPLGLVAGIVIGIIVAKWIGGSGFGGTMSALGVAIGVTCALAFAASGIAVAVAPRTPMIDGQFLALDLDVRMPAGRAAPRDSASPFSVLFYEPRGDHRRHAVLRHDSITESEGREVISGEAELNVVTSVRHVVINDGEDKHYWFDLPLKASPTLEDEQWTDWWPPPGQKASNDVSGTGGFQIRYRVRRLPPSS
jgi:hypothetical protein